MEWTEESTIELIESYRTKEILWNTKHRSYYNKIKKNDAWQELGEQFNIRAEECKKKMNALLSSMRREKAKIKKSQSTGAGFEDVYESSWFAFKSLLFLWDKNKLRERQSTIQDTDDDIEENERSGNDVKETDLVAADTRGLRTGATRRLTAMTSNEKRQKKSKDSRKLDEAFKILSQAASNRSEDKNNEYTIFGKLVAKKLTKYSLELQITVQQDIMNILFEADREHYNQTSNRNNSGHSPSYLSCPLFSNGATPCSVLQQYQDSRGINYTLQQSPLPSPTHIHCTSSNYSSSNDVTPRDAPFQQEILDIKPDMKLEDL